MKQVTFAVCGFGIRGMEAYSSYQKTHPDEMRITAVADPDPAKREIAQRVYGVPAAQCFSSAQELLAQPRLADVMIIATQDRQHVQQAIPAMEKGYHLLLEKPISPSLSECIALREKAHETGRAVIVCHVLRYTQFYGAIKRLLQEGAVGRIESVQAAENVAYWHYAHSYVRGNWRRCEDSSPMVLAKSCHDMDILRWLIDAPCLRVSSYGSLDWFKKENAPEGCAERCLDGCSIKSTCPYDAEKIYLYNDKSGYDSGNREWPLTVLCTDPTPEKLMAALRSGPYGRCVYHCDNDVVDHQVVNMEFDGGVTATFTMSAFTARCYRTIKIMGSMGELEGDLDTNTLVLRQFGQPDRSIALDPILDRFAGHGGGDEKMMAYMCSLFSGGTPKQQALTSVDVSVESHIMSLAAEASRLAGGASIDLRQFAASANGI